MSILKILVNHTKKNPSIFPIFIIIVAGGTLAFSQSLRLLLRSPDVSWTNKREAEPWNYYKDKQFKLYSPSDFNKIKTAPPEY